MSGQVYKSVGDWAWKCVSEWVEFASVWWVNEFASASEWASLQVREWVGEFVSVWVDEFTSAWMSRRVCKCGGEWASLQVRELVSEFTSAWVSGRVHKCGRSGRFCKCVWVDEFTSAWISEQVLQVYEWTSLQVYERLSVFNFIFYSEEANVVPFIECTNVSPLSVRPLILRRHRQCSAQCSTTACWCTSARTSTSPWSCSTGACESATTSATIPLPLCTGRNSIQFIYCKSQLKYILTS